MGIRPFFSKPPDGLLTPYQADELADVDPDFQTLRNLNTPEDYEAALRDLR